MKLNSIDERNSVITSVTLFDKSLRFFSYGTVMPRNSSSFFFMSDAFVIKAWIEVERQGVVIKFREGWVKTANKFQFK